MQDRDQLFQQIKAQYQEFEQQLKDAGKGLVYSTEKGIYGTTNIDNIYAFFKEINLQNYAHFLDLGCGDGRVVLIASLFTKSTGLEYDKELVAVAEEIKNKLNLGVELIVGDYTKHNFSNYDIIFMNPDHEFQDIDDKLKTELNGPLFIYNEIFAPNKLKKGKKYWYDQSPITKYTV